MKSTKFQISQSHAYKGYHLCDVSRKMVMNQQFWQSFFLRFFSNISDQKLSTSIPSPSEEVRTFWLNRRLVRYCRWKCLNVLNFGKFIFVFYLCRSKWSIPNRCILIHPNRLSEHRFFSIFVELFRRRWYRANKKIYQSVVPNVGNKFQYFIVYLGALMWFMTFTYQLRLWALKGWIYLCWIESLAILQSSISFLNGRHFFT